MAIQVLPIYLALAVQSVLGIAAYIVAAAVRAMNQLALGTAKKYL